MNKIISLSLFGHHPAYFQGAIENCRLSITIFPGWNIRIYVSDRIEPSVRLRLSEAGAEVITMHQTSSYDGLFWRFLPAADVDAEAFIVRDIDSRLNERDKAAVDEWLESEKPLHIIRDHPGQQALIPAGLWGGRTNIVHDIAQLIEEFGLKHGFDHSAGDRDFLHKIYTRYQSRAYIHSEFTYFDGELPNRIPIKRNGSEYLGYPPDRGEISKKRIQLFESRKNEGLVLRKFPKSQQ